MIVSIGPVTSPIGVSVATLSPLMLSLAVTVGSSVAPVGAP